MTPPAGLDRLRHLSRTLFDRLERLPPGLRLAAVFLLALAAYGNQAVLPAFNPDDVTQIQDIPDLTNVLFPAGRWGFAQGRWGYHAVFGIFQGANPGGIGIVALGTLLIVAASTLAARLVDLRSGAATLVFVALASVSLHYTFAFDYDSTRLVYPLAVFLAVYGLYRLAAGHPVSGLALMAASPGFYPAGLEVAACVFLASVVATLCRAETPVPWRRFAWIGGAIVAALALYFIGTKAVYALMDWPLRRFSPEASGLLAGAARILDLFSQYSIPWYRHPYFADPLLRTTALGACAGFWGFVLLRRRAGLPWGRWFAAVAAGLLLAMAPYAYAFAAPAETFPPRALVGFATVAAAWVAIPLDAVLARHGPALHAGAARAGALLALGTCLLAAHTLQSNAFAYDRFLSSQADLLAVNRVIADIEARLADHGLTGAARLPLAVVYRAPRTAGPRGPGESARWAEWSREWIFRLVDNRFTPMPEARRQAVLADIPPRPGWPHRDAIVIRDGVTVVFFD